MHELLCSTRYTPEFISLKEQRRYKQDCLSVKNSQPLSHTHTHTCFSSGDLDPMTLVSKYDLDIMKMYPHIKNKLSRSKLSTVNSSTDKQTQTDRQTDRQM